MLNICHRFLNLNYLLVYNYVFMAGNTNTPNVDLSRIEGALSDVKTNSGYLSNLGNIDKGISDIFNTLSTFTNGISQSAAMKGAKNTNANKNGDKDFEKPLKDNTAAIKSLTTSVNSTTKQISSLNTILKELNKTLKGDGKASTKNVKNSSVSGDFADMTQELKDIKGIISEIRDEVKNGGGKGGAAIESGFGKESNYYKLKEVESARELERYIADEATRLLESSKDDKEVLKKLEEKFGGNKIGDEILSKLKGGKLSDKVAEERQRLQKEDLAVQRERNKIDKGRNEAELRKQRRQELWAEKTKGYNIATSTVNGLTKLGAGGLKTSDILNNTVSTISQFSPLAGAIVGLIKMGFDKYNEQQKFGSDYARTYGGGRYGMREYMRNASRMIWESPWKSGVTADETFKMLSAITDATGRSALGLDAKTMQKGVEMSRMGITMDMAGQFDTFGRSIEGMSKYFDKVYQRVSKSGLSFKKVTDVVKSNLKMAQTYTFSKGVDGLQKMAEQSVRLKYNLAEVSKFAEKVSTVEGSLKAGAGLSVLGGTFAQYSNPLSMMYESLNDMEALQDRMQNMFKGMATWNEEKKMIEVNPYDKLRIRAAAEAMGVDQNEALNIAMNQERERMIKTQLGGKYDKETSQYIANLAQIDSEGKGYIERAGRRVYFTDEEFKGISNETFKREAEEKAKERDLGDVFMQTRTIYETLDKYLSSIAEKLGALVAKFVGAKGTAVQNDYWDNLSSEEKAKLIQKYGGRAKARRAVRHGFEDEEISKKYGGDNVIDYINENKKWGFSATGTGLLNYSKHVNGMSISDFVEQYNNGNATVVKTVNDFQKKKNGIEDTSDKVQVKQPSVRNVSDYSSNYAPNTRNSMNITRVAPTTTGSNKQELDVKPMTLNLTGEFKLSDANGNNRNVNINQLNTKELNQAILAVLSENIPYLMKKMNYYDQSGNSGQNFRFRGSTGQG